MLLLFEGKELVNGLKDGYECVVWFFYDLDLDGQRMWRISEQQALSFTHLRSAVRLILQKCYRGDIAVFRDICGTKSEIIEVIEKVE